jgi:hypothetical protein
MKSLKDLNNLVIVIAGMLMAFRPSQEGGGLG